MIKCPNCGKEAPDNAAFCTECGTKLKKAEAVQQQPQAQAQAQPQAQHQPQAQAQPQPQAQAQPQPQAQAQAQPQPQAQPQAQVQPQAQAQVQAQPQAQHLGAGAIPVLTLEGDPAPTVPPKPADPMSGGFKTAAPAADPGRSANTYAQNQGAYAQNPNVRPQNPPQAAQGAQAQNAQNPNAYAQNQRTSAQNPNTYAQNPNAYAQNPNTYAQNPNAYTPPYTAAPSTGAPDKKSPYAVLGIGGNMLNLFVIALPIIGFIVTLIWAFGGTNNLNRRNYACAVLIWWLIGIAAAIVLAILGVTVLAPFFSEILYYLSDFTGMY